MLQQTFLFISTILDQYLQNKFSIRESKVIHNSITLMDGAIPPANKNKIVLTLINIEQETLKPFYNRTQQLSDGSYSDVNPSERFNLNLLITANFDDYSEALKFLGSTIAFFQTNVSITPVVFGNMPKGVNRLDFDIEKINYTEMQGLWTSLGAKYQPSVIYKVRLVTIKSGHSKGIIPQVKQSENSIENV